MLFGSSNAEITTTVTNTIDQKTDERDSNIINFIQTSPTDLYNVNLYFDNLF